MKLFFTLFGLFFLSCVGPKTMKSSDITAIYWGKSFGMCRGYCYSEYQFQEEGKKLIRRGWDTIQYPKTIEAFPPNPGTWEILKSMIDLDDFNQLEETLGCPDCADGGAEWIQIIGLGYSKKVTYEYGDSPAGLEAILVKLRELDGQ